MSKNKENKFEYVDECYEDLIKSIEEAKKYTSDNGKSLLDSLGNFAKLYLDYYKRVVNSGTSFDNGTYMIFDSATKRDYLYLIEHKMVAEEHKDALEDVHVKLGRFYNAARPIEVEGSKNRGKK